MQGPKEKDDEKQSDKPETSVLGPMEAAFVATFDGWRNSDTAQETGVSEQEAAEAAAGDDETTN